MPIDRTGLLCVNLNIRCDFERFLYSELDCILFCDEECFMGYLKKKKFLGPLSLRSGGREGSQAHLKSLSHPALWRWVMVANH